MPSKLAYAEIVDTWYATGLAGSGSNDYRVRDVFVPAEHSFHVLDSPKRKEPLYRCHGFFFASVRGIPFGVARAALDEAKSVAATKQSYPAVQLVRQDPGVQAAFGEAEAMLAAARAYVSDTMGAAWDTLVQGDELSLPQRAGIGLCITFAGQSAQPVVDAACTIAGSTALYRKSPLERLRRDMIRHQLPPRASAEDLRGGGGHPARRGDRAHLLPAPSREPVRRGGLRSGGGAWR